jgi:hypothetical protein
VVYCRGVVVVQAYYVLLGGFCGQLRAGLGVDGVGGLDVADQLERDSRPHMGELPSSTLRMPRLKVPPMDIYSNPGRAATPISDVIEEMAARIIQSSGTTEAGCELVFYLAREFVSPFSCDDAQLYVANRSYPALRLTGAHLWSAAVLWLRWQGRCVPREIFERRAEAARTPFTLETPPVISVLEELFKAFVILTFVYSNGCVDVREFSYLLDHASFTPAELQSGVDGWSSMSARGFWRAAAHLGLGYLCLVSLKQFLQWAALRELRKGVPKDCPTPPNVWAASRLLAETIFRAFVMGAGLPWAPVFLCLLGNDLNSAYPHPRFKPRRFTGSSLSADRDTSGIELLFLV